MFLDAAKVEQYRSDGFIILPDVFNTAEVNALLDAVEQAIYLAAGQM